MTIHAIHHTSSEQLHIIGNLNDHTKKHDFCSTLQAQGFTSQFDINTSIATVSLDGYGLNHDQTIS